MGKKKKKKKKRNQRGASQGADRPRASHAAGSGVGSRQHRPPGASPLSSAKRLRRAVDAGELDAAERLLERLAPPADETPDPARLELLWRAWPARFCDELVALSPAARQAPPVEAAVAAAALALPETAAARLEALDAPWSAGLAALRSASAHLAAGRDQEAAASLRTLGLRSPFRDGRLFLRGLGAYYDHRAAEGIRALERVRDHRSYGAAARALLARLRTLPGAEPDGPAAPSLAAEGGPAGAGARIPTPPSARRGKGPGAPDASLRWLTALSRGCGDPELVDLALLEHVHAHLAAGSANRALRAATRIPCAGESPLGQALRRDLVAMLVDQGVDSEFAATRVQRALGPDASDPGGARLTALAATLEQDADLVLDALEEHLHQLTRGRLDAYGEDRTLAEAALHHQRGTILAKLDRDDLDMGPLAALGFSIRRRGRPETTAAQQAFENALARDPAHGPTWAALHAEAKKLRDRAEANRVLERWVKEHPEDPRTLLAAARAARRRGALDKARRYVATAIALEPMDRDLRSLEGDLLSDKAVKKARAGRVDLAHALCQEAAGIRDLAPEARRRALGVEIALLGLAGDEPAAREAHARALEVEPRPWVLGAAVVLATVDLVPERAAVRSRRGRPPARARALSHQIPEDLVRPAAPPGAADLSALLELDAAARRDDPAAATLLGPLLHDALSQGVAALADVQAFERALDAAGDPRLLLDLATQGNERFPTHPRLLAVRLLCTLLVGEPLPDPAAALADARRLRPCNDVGGIAVADLRDMFVDLLDHSPYPLEGYLAEVMLCALTGAFTEEEGFERDIEDLFSLPPLTSEDREVVALTYLELWLGRIAATRGSGGRGGGQGRPKPRRRTRKERKERKEQEECPF